jgi:hypothetical protein
LLEVALSTIFPLRIIIIYVQLSVVDRQWIIESDNYIDVVNVWLTHGVLWQSLL